MNTLQSLISKTFFIAPLIIVYLLMLFITFCYCLYFIFDNEIKLEIKLIHCILTITSIVLLIICHIKTLITNPGNIPVGFSLKEYKEDLFCKKCNKTRPERAHHCQQCNKCILKMDHHCPWVGNCVGYYNQKYFVLFLFYVILACCLIFTALLPKFKLLDEYIEFERRNIDNKEVFRVPNYYPLLVVLSTVLPAILTISVGILLITQIYLVINNLTTVENIIYKSKSSSPFNLKSYLLHMKIVFGFNYLEWLLPVFHPNEYNNGISFKKYSDDMENAERAETLV